jgi:urocanate hydratase
VTIVGCCPVLAHRGEAAQRLKRVLDGDRGIGVLRRADAGYDIAIEQAGRSALSATVPLGLPGQLC